MPWSEPVPEARVGARRMSFSLLKRLAIVLPIAVLFSLWILVHVALRDLHRYPYILILGGLVMIGVVAFALSVFAVVARLERQIDGAVIEERLRIARELHDGVAQVLTYANAQTTAVQRLLAEDRGEEAAAELHSMQHATRQVYGDVHEAILSLRTSLERPGLVPALRETLDRFERIAGTAPELILSGSIDELELPAPTEVQLLRIVQEALANVRKHAVASSVTVRLRLGEDSVLQLEIEDDGQGFNPAAVQPSDRPRFGLQTMRERAQALAASFAVKSRPGVGTRVIVTVPLVEAKAGTVADPAR